MIRILIMLFTIQISFSATLDECKNQAGLLGDGQGNDIISNACLTLFLSRTNGNQTKTSSSGHLRVSVIENVLIFEDLNNSKIGYTAGSQSNIPDSVAISIDEDNQEVAILDNITGEVKFYSSYITGNIAPLRVIKSTHFVGAHDLAINSATNEVSVINGDNGQMWTYSRLADSNRRAGKKSDEVKASKSDLPIGIRKISIDSESGVASFDYERKKK